MVFFLASNQNIDSVALYHQLDCLYSYFKEKLQECCTITTRDHNFSHSSEITAVLGHSHQTSPR